MHHFSLSCGILIVFRKWIENITPAFWIWTWHLHICKYYGIKMMLTWEWTEFILIIFEILISAHLDVLFQGICVFVIDDWIVCECAYGFYLYWCFYICILYVYKKQFLFQRTWDSSQYVVLSVALTNGIYSWPLID